MLYPARHMRIRIEVSDNVRFIKRALTESVEHRKIKRTYLVINKTHEQKQNTRDIRWKKT